VLRDIIAGDFNNATNSAGDFNATNSRQTNQTKPTGATNEEEEEGRLSRGEKE
jgi:hypothetical protein